MITFMEYDCIVILCWPLKHATNATHYKCLLPTFTSQLWVTPSLITQIIGRPNYTFFE